LSHFFELLIVSYRLRHLQSSGYWKQLNQIITGYFQDNEILRLRLRYDVQPGLLLDFFFICGLLSNFDLLCLQLQISINKGYLTFKQLISNSSYYKKLLAWVQVYLVYLFHQGGFLGLPVVAATILIPYINEVQHIQCIRSEHW
jgi:hypothetical protein